jgi:hypothetical protein
VATTVVSTPRLIRLERLRINLDHMIEAEDCVPFVDAWQEISRMAKIFQRVQQREKYPRCHGLPAAKHLESRRIWRCGKQSKQSSIALISRFVDY